MSSKSDNVTDLRLYHGKATIQTVMSGEGMIEPPKPYCHRHVWEAENKGEVLIGTNTYTNRKCIKCE